MAEEPKVKSWAERVAEQELNTEEEETSGSYETSSYDPLELAKATLFLSLAKLVDAIAKKLNA